MGGEIKKARAFTLIELLVMIAITVKDLIWWSSITTVHG
jgi:competence protein ComGC